jgi:hypothetical protein
MIDKSSFFMLYLPRVGRVARTPSYTEGAPSSGFEGGSWV